MSRSCEKRFPGLVDRVFVRELPARQRRQLRDHLGTCEPCRGRWDRLAIVDRQLGGPRLGKQLIDDIGDRVIPPPRPRYQWWAGGVLGAVASAALGLVIISADRTESKFSPRGGSSFGRTPGVRLFCVAGDADHVRGEARMVSSGPAPELRCNIEDDLQFAYTTPDREGLTMVAFTRLDSTMIQYAPTSNTEAAMAVRPNRVDELVDWSTSLAAEHRPGRYDVVVRFFDRDVSTRDAIGGGVVPVVELHARLEIAAGGLDDVR